MKQYITKSYCKWHYYSIMLCFLSSLFIVNVIRIYQLTCMTWARHFTGKCHGYEWADAERGKWAIIIILIITSGTTFNVQMRHVMLILRCNCSMFNV